MIRIPEDVELVVLSKHETPIETGHLSLRRTLQNDRMWRVYPGGVEPASSPSLRCHFCHVPLQTYLSIMPYFPPRIIPIMESPGHNSPSRESTHSTCSTSSQSKTPERIRTKNRRLRYLELHPEYFGPSLELADPLLYDRLIRRFQSTSEREAEGRKKGYSGTMEADLWRAEAKLDALQHPDPNATFQYKRGPNGEVFAEDRDEVPDSKEEGMKRWKYEMEMRFLRGDDEDFEYADVDCSEEFDDRAEEEREELDEYLEGEEAGFVLEDGQEPKGETGVQDF
jgi:hypothetical protein